jgi:hypothetical protein
MSREETHETKLMDSSFFLREIKKQQGIDIGLEEELSLEEAEAENIVFFQEGGHENSEDQTKIMKIIPNGGNQKMRKRTKIGAIAIAGTVLATYLLTAKREEYNIDERNEVIAQREMEIQFLEDTRYTLEEVQRITELRRELYDQVNEANWYLNRLNESERTFREFIGDARTYVENSMPRGELEEDVVEEVEGMNNYFDSCSSRETAGSIEECRRIYNEVRENENSTPRSRSRRLVSELNDQYFSTLAEIRRDAEADIENLSRFREYADNYPLRQRSAMIARTDQEIEARRQIAEQIGQYIAVFAENRQSDDILPVAMRERPDEIAMSHN